MSKPANKTMIGIFVLGAIALLLTGVMVFGSGKFFKTRVPYVLFFEGSLKGLAIGSPVAFRGIRVGEVTNIEVLLNRARADVLIPVFIELDPERFSAVGEGTKRPKILDKKERQMFVNRLIENGMRAQLQMQSLVTGQLMINLDLFPNKPVHLVGAKPDYIELPTVPTDFQELGKTLEKIMAKLEEIPWEQLVKDLTNAADGLDKLINRPEVQESFVTLHKTLQDLQLLADSLNKQVGPTAESLRGTSAAATAAIQQTAVNIEATSTAAKAALEQATRTLAKTERFADGDSTLGHQLAVTLEEIRAAASSLRALTDTLERHPDALIRGKGSQGGK